MKELTNTEAELKKACIQKPGVFRTQGILETFQIFTRESFVKIVNCYDYFGKL